MVVLFYRRNQNGWGFVQSQHKNSLSASWLKFINFNSLKWAGGSRGHAWKDKDEGKAPVGTKVMKVK